MGRPRNDATSDEPGRSRTRLTLPLTPDGSGIDFASMRGATKTALHRLVESDLRSIYVEAGQPDPLAEPDAGGADPFGGITQENVAACLDLLGQVNAMALRLAGPRFLKHPYRKDAKTGRPVPLVFDPDVLSTSFTLTKEQHAELDPRAHRIAQKLSGKMPEWLRRNLDVYMLIGMYVQYTATNAKTALETQIKRDLATDTQRIQKQAKPKPMDTDRVADPFATRLGDDEPMNTGTVDTYPDPAAGNGGMAAEL